MRSLSALGSKPPIWRRLLIPSDLSLENCIMRCKRQWAGKAATCINLPREALITVAGIPISAWTTSKMKKIPYPDHPEYEEMLDWLGGEFDPEEFDIEEANDHLKMMSGRI